MPRLGERRSIAHEPLSPVADRVLRSLLDAPAPLSLDLIAAYTILPRHAVADALIELIDAGYVEQAGNDPKTPNLWSGSFTSTSRQQAAAG